MKLNDLITILAESPAKNIAIRLPGGKSVPAHFHVTEVGRVRKDFIDCGGTERTLEACVLQVWVAGDIDHRLDTDKLSVILDLSKKLFPSLDINVEIEYEDTNVSLFPLETIHVENGILVMTLVTKHTDCLAKDKCGVGGEATEDESCCSPSTGCC